MGSCFSTENKEGGGGSSKNQFFCFKDKYKTLEQVQDALQNSGLESSNLIVAIDYTASNAQTGKVSFGGKNLHTIGVDIINPYQHAIKLIGKTLEKFDEDKLIPVFGFGDQKTKANGIFKLMSPKTQNGDCYTFNNVIEIYNQITPRVILSGPTNFAPPIKKAIEIVKQQQDYHILLLITDGQVINEDETIDAIREASNFPLSIVIVGVGDGPFNTMDYFDDAVKGRKFDNLQFVSFSSLYQKCLKSGKLFDIEFTVSALQEIPEQFNAIKRLKLFSNCTSRGLILGNQQTLYYGIPNQPQQQQFPQNPNFNGVQFN